MVAPQPPHSLTPRYPCNGAKTVYLFLNFLVNLIIYQARDKHKETHKCFVCRHAYGGSAICWMYGRRIQERYPTIPLGLIQAHVGGTAIEPWSPPVALGACGIKPAFHRAQAGVSCPPYCNTSSLFNGEDMV